VDEEVSSLPLMKWLIVLGFRLSGVRRSAVPRCHRGFSRWGKEPELLQCPEAQR
jgi:hypothetical protein